MSRWMSVAAVLAVACAACVPAAASELDVITPTLDKAELREERARQKERTRSGLGYSNTVSLDWNWLTMTQVDLLTHSIPLLQANVDLCEPRTVFVPNPTAEGEHVEICDYLPFLIPNPYPNAFTDGYSIFFTSGMLRSFENSDEFRAVLGHEMAHILAGHLRKQSARDLIIGIVSLGVSQWGNLEIGSFWDLAGKFASMKFNRKYELEADYIGAYLAARSGGDVSTAAHMWHRWGTGRKGTFLDSHPSDSKRFVNLRATASEIAEKRENGLRIFPNVKAPKKPSAAAWQ